MQISVEELAELIGNKEIEIMVLKKELAKAKKLIEELQSAKKE